MLCAMRMRHVWVCHVTIPQVRRTHHVRIVSIHARGHMRLRPGTSHWLHARHPWLHTWHAWVLRVGHTRRYGALGWHGLAPCVDPWDGLRWVAWHGGLLRGVGWGLGRAGRRGWCGWRRCCSACCGCCYLLGYCYGQCCTGVVCVLHCLLECLDGCGVEYLPLTPEV